MTASVAGSEPNARLRALTAVLTGPYGANELGGVLGENRGHREISW
jgi:hypothetical protein